ncbi:MAG: class I SAM-dependent methyltransferase [Culturomica sp.]|jgi:2-polyprenyl-3-methyl-5-hydroxy-6-metoxy-1,4-benzoquinol methylase|nr:class I SAM-dependent methyltransferase [Culturomica sp.]
MTAEVYLCKICDSSDTEIVFVNEKMFGTEKPFKYIKCSACGCLQLAENISDMSEFYASDYYSFSRRQSFTGKIKSFFEDHLLKHVALSKMGITDPIGRIAARFKEYYEYYFTWISKLHLNKESQILDVGCGSGILLKRLSLLGYKNLHGADPFIEKDIVERNYKVDKKSLYDLTGEYDLIMLHHSFEHMDLPHEVLECLKKRLKSGGTVLIRIPVIDSYAFEEYGMDWFQLDAPRHLFLHTRKSIEYLLNLHGLHVESVINDSTSNQFLYSERYRYGYGLHDTRYNFSGKRSKYLRKLTKQLNESDRGDQICLIIKKDRNCSR